MGILHDIFGKPGYGANTPRYDPPPMPKCQTHSPNFVPPASRIPVPEPRIVNVNMPQADNRRPCWARGRKAMFHRWVESAHPVPPRNIQAEQIDEKTRYFQYCSTQALVEFEDGTCARVWPNEVQFADLGGFDEYAWRPMTEGGRKMAQSKEELISRQELLALIQDHAEAIKTTDPRQHAVLAYWQTVVEALPAKAVAVEVTRCQDCEYWDPDPDTYGDGNGPRGHCHCILDDTMLKTAFDDFCGWGERRADHGKD